MKIGFQRWLNSWTCEKNIGFSWTAPGFLMAKTTDLLKGKMDGTLSSSTNSGNWDIYATNQQTAKPENG